MNILISVKKLDNSNDIKNFLQSTIKKATKMIVDSCEIWLQEGCNETYYCTQFIENSKPLDTKLFQNELNTQIYKVVDLLIDPDCREIGYEFCYVLPILPDKIEDHFEYCRRAMNEEKNATIAACKSFGMIKFDKWILETDEGSYAVYYQTMREPIEIGRETFLLLKDNPKALEATKRLREHTGLTFEELYPYTTRLFAV